MTQAGLDGRPTIAVVGGGISGLTAAWTLAELVPDARVVVLEAAAQIGGKLGQAELAGRVIDTGAEAILARRPEGLDLLGAAGLGDRLITPATTSASIYAGGALHPLPARTMMGVPGDVAALRASGVLTADAVETVAAEPGAEPMAALEDDVAVGVLVRDRLGSEVRDRLVEPLLGGVYAGRADELSLAATMPALAARLRREGGSLVEAAASVVDVGTRVPSSDPVFVSTDAGVGALPVALAASGRFEVRTGVAVRALERTPVGFRLATGPVPESEYLNVEGVVLAVPAGKAAALLGGVAPVAAAELAGVETASMAVVSLAYESVELPAGSGVLVGVGEGLAVKAATFSSQKWPGTPDGLVLLRASIGRAGETRDLQRDDEDLVRLVRADLARIAGLSARPIDALVTRWGGGLPQYAVGHLDRVRRIRESVAEVAGLAVCGAVFDGVGIPACIAAARAAAQRVADQLDSVGQRSGSHAPGGE